VRARSSSAIPKEYEVIKDQTARLHSFEPLPEATLLEHRTHEDFFLVQMYYLLRNNDTITEDSKEQLLGAMRNAYDRKNVQTIDEKAEWLDGIVAMLSEHQVSVSDQQYMDLLSALDTKELVISQQARRATLNNMEHALADLHFLYHLAGAQHTGGVPAALSATLFREMVEKNPTINFDSIEDFVPTQDDRLDTVPQTRHNPCLGCFTPQQKENVTELLEAQKYLPQKPTKSKPALPVQAQPVSAHAR
jgi:hypothetical protein